MAHLLADVDYEIGSANLSEGKTFVKMLEKEKHKLFFNVSVDFNFKI